MSPWRPWPYAATAIVQHQWDTNHLDVWVVFRHPMDQTVKPANGLWLCEADGVPKNTSASVWQDEWTILLTVDNVLALPFEVTLEYDGPDDDLRTTWDKQWEPWGPILSQGVLASSSIVTAAINPNTALDVKFFEDLTIDNAADGRMIEIFRNAAEGKDSLQVYIDQYRLPVINSTAFGGYIFFRSLGSAKFVIRTDCIEFRQGAWMRVDGNGALGCIGFGAGTIGDARIWYDSVNMKINPKAIGTGYLQILGTIRIDEDVIATKKIASGTLTHSAVGPTDNLDVSDVNTVFIDCAGGNVTIGGFVGGVNGQTLNIVRLCAAANDATLEHNEAHAFQKIFLHKGLDETLTGEYGGWTLVCNGTSWFDASHAKHV